MSDPPSLHPMHGLTVGQRTQTDELAEVAVEVAGVVEAGKDGDVGDGEVGFLQIGTCGADAAAEHVFHRGSAHIAIQSASPVELVSMDCDMNVLAKGQPWWDVGDRTATYKVQCKGCIDAADFAKGEESSKEAAIRLNDMMQKGVFGT